MRILGIETSCDETAASVVEDGKKILSNVVVSQIDIFAEYGGVIPEVASRSHLEVIQPVIKKALLDFIDGLIASRIPLKLNSNARIAYDYRSSTEPYVYLSELPDKDRLDIAWDNIDAIAVTHTPGLLGSLLIGTLTARTLAILHDKPLYATHHLKSHIYANWLDTGDIKEHYLKYNREEAKGNLLPAGYDDDLAERSDSYYETGFIDSSYALIGRPGFGNLPMRGDIRTWPERPGARSGHRQIVNPAFPLLAMVISGGHTQIISMTAHNSFEIVGTTRDDAIGECFDKVAKIIGLPYPGGPAIAEAARYGNPNRYKFPIPLKGSLDFSFSGLKTAVLRAVQKAVDKPISFPSHELPNLLKEEQVANFAASFQNCAIDVLLDKLDLAIKQYKPRSIVFAGGVSANALLREKAEIKYKDIPVFFPDPKLSGDNGAMVAAAAYYETMSKVPPTDPYSLDISPRSTIK